MRLSSIKLSGFKSFAEPTNFMLPGQLVGVVGPNGCGKSNIMDAVRWVLGESRASELRGESMQDVIFNGTNSRKPSSRSSVELVFDNADHRAGGQWSQYAEIAVKRVLTRDGTSSYYINNQPVRRRDVQDVFLGTGLGPRAYAIIGQGTISRIIESKPEELRLFLEEAAGVSKYKERRRETENRLADTRENLTRVDDILRELNANLDKLEKQAEVAHLYHALNKQFELKRHQMWFLKHQEAQSVQVALTTQAAQAATDLEGRITELRRIESELETIRQAHYAAGDKVNQAQGLMYEANAEVGRLEAEIRFVVDGRNRAQSRLELLATQRQQWLNSRSASEAELAELLTESQHLAEQHAQLAERSGQAQQQLPLLEQVLLQAQHKADGQRSTVQQVQQQIQVLAADQRAIAEQSRQLGSRQERLMSDRQALQSPDETRLTQLKTQWDQARQSSEAATLGWKNLEAEVPLLDAQRRQAQERLNQEGARHTDGLARLEALQSLQEQLKVDVKLQPWLQKHGLEGLQALWSKVHIQSGWENALEAALRERLHALEVSRLEMVKALGQDAPPVKLSFYAPPGERAPREPAAMARLADLLQVGDAGLTELLQGWLSGCYTAPDLERALSQREGLQAWEVIYTALGHAVSRDGVHFYAPDNERAGMLARAQEIENLAKQVRAQALIHEEARASLARAESAYAQASQQLQTARRDVQQWQAQSHELELEFNRLTQWAEQTRQRAHLLDTDLAEVQVQLDELLQRGLSAQDRFESLDMQLADSQERHAQLEQQVRDAQSGLDAGREQLRAIERASQEADFARRTQTARESELRRTADTAQQQLGGMDEEERRLKEELEQLSDVAAQAGLQAALALKSEREQSLALRRNEYEDLTARLRASDERRLAIERELEPMRQRITDLRLKEQAARLGLEQYQQFLHDAQADWGELERAILEQGVRLAGLPSEIDRIQREITSLGAVNLAALDELSSARERKTFLDAQLSDLTEAMQTLEDAIHKIDAETRDLLGSTFSTVNEHFGRMFPELFGGGHARLVMTGEEILDSGVQVMAQPPGKKNQTIHLLSGGEKALTAIALVFAIFQLNPAPFCLLDEVDAPLDDANTERYVKLVGRMSNETQFLFISHNKIAMEMAEQLIGVTMQEQGVSRIVAVDMEAAVSMTDSN